ncbi:MAG: Mur ligase family protein [bacterium]|nr:Mur ligase family protein [bacterium]
MPVLDMNKVTSFKEAYQFLVTTVPKTSATAFKGKGGFAQSKLWMASLGNPQNTHPAIHIAGTSGKGTTSHLISSILEAHNQKTALITSPHAYDLRERILIGGKKLSHKSFVQVLNRLLPNYAAMKKMGTPPSYFETLMALGFLAANRGKVDYCIVETGVGGKLDTSNTITRPDKLCVLTSIGYDHMNILGNTLQEIASQKAGIIQTRQRVFSAHQSEEAMGAIRTRCLEVQAKLTVVDAQKTLKRYGISNLPKLNRQLYGAHNRSNLALTLEVAEYIAKRDGWDIKPTAVKNAIKDFEIPGRFEIANLEGEREFVFDGAHNEQKLTALIDAVKERYGNERVGFVFASSKEDPGGKLKILKKRASVIILTRYHSKELDMVRPQVDLEPLANGKDILYIPKAKDIVAYIKSSTIKNWVVTGSFYILGEIKDLLR